ncbi:MAG: glycosyltransferase, partial [Nitratireductor sp.]
MQAMTAHGHEVLALAPGLDAATRSKLSAMGVQPVEISLSRTGMNPLSDLRDVISLYAQLRRLKPQVVFAYTIKPVIYGTFAATLARVPRRFALVTGLGYVFSDAASPRNRIVQKVAQQFYRIALRRAEAVFVQNPDDADELVARGIVPRDKIVQVNGSGVDLVT